MLREGSKVGLFFLKDEEASFSELSISRKTKPATVTVKRGPKAALSIEPMERDRDFCHLMGEAMGNEIYSSVFLVSEEFDLAWADNSLRQLKKKQRRIFGGTRSAHILFLLHTSSHRLQSAHSMPENQGFGDMFPASHKIWHETMGEV